MRLTYHPIERAKKSHLFRGFAAALTGQSLTMLIPLAAAPLLGRIYAPDEYALLGTFMALNGLLGTFATLGYSKAIMSEASDAKALALVAVCIAIGLAMALPALLLSVIAYLVLHSQDVSWGAKSLILTLPLTVVATAINDACTSLGIRFRQHRAIAQNRVANTIVATCSSVILGALGWSSAGLLVAYLLSQLCSSVMFLRLSVRFNAPLVLGSNARYKSLIRRHRDFALFSTPAGIAATALQSLPVFALSFLGEAALLGAFTRARQLIFLPVSLIGSSLGQVFYTEASLALRTQGTFRSLYVKTFFILATLGAIGVIGLFIFAVPFFTIYLGPKWAVAGEVARILSPLLLLRLVATPLSVVFNFSGHQRRALTLNITGLSVGSLLTGLTLIIGFHPYLVIASYAFSFGLLCIWSVINTSQIALAAPSVARN